MLAHSLQVEAYDWFFPATEFFNRLLSSLKDHKSNAMTASELERLIKEQCQNIAREAIQAKFNMIGVLESATVVTDSDGVVRPRKKLRERTVETIFGDVTYQRWGYRAETGSSLFPADGHLNLPPEKYTHEVRRLVSEDVTRSSYDEALDILSRRTAVTVPKRQGEELAARAAADFVDFYDHRACPPEDSGALLPEKAKGSLLILTTDGKGVVMRREGLREGTKKAAEQERHKLKTRLTAGEKKNRKRMSQVASVYTIAPHVRTAEDIAGCAPVVEGKERKRPRPEDKRVWASVEREPEEVIPEMFQEAQARDPHHEKPWIALVDGNKQQLRLLKEQAKAFAVTLIIIIDFIHVLEYLWKAAHAFYQQGDPQCEQLVSERLLLVLLGNSGQVADDIQQMATDRKMPQKKREAVDTCASYLRTYKEYLHYWDYHQKREQERNHNCKYQNGLPPLRDNDVTTDRPKNRGHLRS